MFSVDVRSRKLVQLLGKNRNMDLQTSLSGVRARKWDENGTVFMSARTRVGGRQDPAVRVAGYTRGRVDLYEVDGQSGRGSRVARGGENTDQWVVKPDGEVVARIEQLDKSNRYRILAPQDRGWEVIFSEETDIPNLAVYGTNQSGDSLIIGTRLVTDRYALFEMSIADGTISPTALYEHEYVDVNDPIIDDYTGEIIGAEITNVAREQQFFLGQFVSVVTAVKNALPQGQRVYIESWDRNRERFILFADSESESGYYVLFDIRTGQLSLIARAYPHIKAEHLSPVTPFTYKTRDGVTLQGFLTVPANAEKQSLPLVVMPHGGPESRDQLGYDWWQQFLASRGYAVVQMNFRGSWGYGIGFSQAGFGEWGGKMQDDVTDAVTYLINQGIADPDRVCIVGGSYGGYSALAGAAFTPELYRCAVSYSGVTDLGRMLRWERRRFGPKSSTYKYWVSRVGEPGEAVDSRSPALAADRIKADILLIHGKDDTVVALEQSEAMADALEDADKSYEIVILDGEDHWLSTEDTRVAMLEAIEAFLSKHLGAGT